ncbi:type II CRISPR-associated endonuclease Cas1 [Rubinisphaera italica]|uniref:CRISPR-associated endonuclease Cas1 n=1 Tax=Rubinisphaera italica TaxID=2527969 RepID=A0A5C5XQL4_9PLAN|nr:type II CRISPR-associated endonuclease Cas1 [Rubinisphaera italica]TWT64042.1 CRISPR-associated endonuclease Cas1 [Rubinisphaera italica]
MRNRILEISEVPARLRIERRQLVIESEPRSERIPLEDVAVLVVAHPQVSYTQAVLAELAASGGTFVTCDRSRMPIGILLPLDGNSIQNERFRHQLELSKPRQKQAWKQIIKAKVHMQATLLEIRLQTDAGLRPLISQIRSGDPSNIEGRAARKYWTALFGSDFRRDRDAADHNRLLNYGYAILRAATARAIVAAGLHPSLGLHHHNKYNAYCLADDLMEPYRPIVDRAVAELVDDYDETPEMNQEVRACLLRSLLSSFLISQQQRSLFNALSRTASSLVSIIQGNSDQLELPEDFAHAPA